MPWYHQIGNTLKAFQAHMLGKGVMTLAVLAATLAAPAIGSWVLPLVAIGGVVLTGVNRLYREHLYENDMVNLYRDDLAEQFGIAPEEVTRAHLKEAAKTNEVIEQALRRNRQKTFVAVGTAALASTITVLLCGRFGAESLLKESAQKLFENTALAATANFIGIGTVAGISSLVFSNGLREVLKINTGYGKASANDRIMEMEYQVSHNHAVTKEQVYGVLVAADTHLQNAILHRYGKRWRHMSPHERVQVVADVGCGAEMQAIADQINHGEIRPGHLAYLMHDAATFSRQSATTRLAEAASAHAQSHGAAPQQPAPEGGFVSRLGLAARAHDDFRQRLDAERQNLTEQGAAR